MSVRRSKLDKKAHLETRQNDKGVNVGSLDSDRAWIQDTVIDRVR